MSEEMIKDRIKKERLWNFFVHISKESKFRPPQDRKVEILDIACSVCEEKEVLHSFFGGENNPYHNDNDNVSVTGIDIDNEAIELAKNNLPRNRENNFKFIIGDASNLENIKEVPQSADVVFIRHQQMTQPNYNKENIIEDDLWKKIINEGIKKLDTEGILIITSYTDKEHEFLIDYLKTLNRNIKIISEGENGFSEQLGNGGIDKYYVLIRLQKEQ